MCVQVFAAPQQQTGFKSSGEASSVRLSLNQSNVTPLLADSVLDSLLFAKPVFSSKAMNLLGNNTKVKTLQTFGHCLTSYQEHLHT